MGWIIFSIILGVAAFVGLGFKFEKKEFKDRWGEMDYKIEKVWKINPKQLLAIFALLIMIPAFVAKVPANSVGIQYSPFSGTSKTTLSEGFKVKNPFDTIYSISTEVQTLQVTGLTTQTKDAQFVTTNLDIKYKVNSENAYMIFTQFRTLDKMSNTLVIPTTQRVLELITTKYNVIGILGEERSLIYSELDSALATELAKYGVEFISISLTDMDAGAEIEAAITAEAVAKKAVETAQYELQKAETEAKKQSVVAKAEQDAAKIKSETKIIEAEADKKANELLQQSLNDDILMQMWIERWNGVVPTYYGGDGADLIFNTGNLNP